MSTTYRAVDTARGRRTFTGDWVPRTVEVPSFPYGVSVHAGTAQALERATVPVSYGLHSIETTIRALHHIDHPMARELRVYLLNARIKGATHVRIS